VVGKWSDARLTIGMKLQTVIEGGSNPLLYMERYVDEGAKTYSTLSARTEADLAYRPEGDAPSFNLVTVNVPNDETSVFQADPAPELQRHYLRDGFVLFAVHPQTWECIRASHPRRAYRFDANRSEARPASRRSASLPQAALSRLHFAVQPSFAPKEYPQQRRDREGP
jgi:hypothetical protein